MDTIAPILENHNYQIPSASKETRLLEACSSGDISTVNSLTSTEWNTFPVNLETIDSEYNTPLLLAAKKGHLECVRTLIRAGADLHTRADKDFLTALSDSFNYEELEELFREPRLRTLLSYPELLVCPQKDVPSRLKLAEVLSHPVLAAHCLRLRPELASSLSPSPFKAEALQLSSTMKTQEVSQCLQEKKKIQTIKNSPTFGTGEDLVDAPTESLANPQVQVCLKKISALMREYRETCSVFTHGQSSFAALLTKFRKKVIKRFFPTLYNPLQLAFRFPSSVPENILTAKEFFSQMQGQHIHDNVRNAQVGDMLSVDGFWLNSSGEESAIDFLHKNWNMNFNLVRNRNLCIHLLSSLGLSRMEIEEILPLLEEQLYENKQKIGSLCAIAIPHQVSLDSEKTFIYRSFPGGGQATVATDESAVLRKINQENLRTKDLDGLPLDETQYRILTAGLLQCKEARSFSVTALSQEELRVQKSGLVTILDKIDQLLQRR